MTIDIMLDLETLGTSAGCGILSIGACTFDMKHEFYAKIKPESSTEAGLHINPETMAWWNRQSLEAKRESFSGTEDLVTVLGKFRDWYSHLKHPDGNTKFIWGNGADFDPPILQAAYEAVGMTKPWAPFNGRCYRTLKNLYFDVKVLKTIEGVKHTALFDAKIQAAHAVTILRTHFNRDKD